MRNLFVSIPKLNKYQWDWPGLFFSDVVHLKDESIKTYMEIKRILHSSSIRYVQQHLNVSKENSNEWKHSEMYMTCYMY